MSQPESPTQPRGLLLRRPEDLRRLLLPPVQGRVALAGGVPGPPPAARDRSPHPLTRLRAWLLPYLAFFGLYASSSVCVFCGNPGCPVGAGAAAVAGGFFAALWQWGASGGRQVLHLQERLRGASKGGRHVAGESQKL